MQILSVLKEGEAGIPVDELCRKYEIGHSTYYKWKTKYGGLAKMQIQCYLIALVSTECEAKPHLLFIKLLLLVTYKLLS